MDPGLHEAAVEAARDSSGAVSAREESETAEEGENDQQALGSFGAAFPSVVGEAAGGPPPLPAGEKIAGFASPDMAQVDLSDGERGVIESPIPMAIETGPERWAPVELGLHEAGGAFEAARPLVAVQIPKRLAEGAQLPSVGLSLTPVDGEGQPLAGSEGVLDGASVFFANTGTDSDTVLKPSALGVEASTVLRGVEAPEELFYRVGLPHGASLVQEEGGSRSVQVIEDGTVLATVLPARAEDATGYPVPVSMSVSGSTIVLSVDHREGSYEYPILVDPAMVAVEESVTPSNWSFGQAGGYSTELGFEGHYTVGLRHTGQISVGDWAYQGTTAPGVTKLYEIQSSFYYSPARGEGERNTPPWLDAWLEYSNGRSMTLSGSPYLDDPGLCADGDCDASVIPNGDSLRFEMTVLEPGPSFGENHEEEYQGWLYNPTLFLAQEKGVHATVSYNTAASEVEYSAEHKTGETANVLDGSGWLGPHSGAVELKSHDAGLGVARMTLENDTAEGWKMLLNKEYLKERFCSGKRCTPEQHQTLTYENLAGHLVNGNNTVRLRADDPMPEAWSSEYGEEGEAVIKVDNEPPYNVNVSGLPTTGGISAAPHKIKVEATDGSGSTASAGVKSLSVSVDGGRETVLPASYCSPGPCTVSSEMTLDGEKLGTGEHTLVVTATDNAGNVAPRKEYVFSVRSASPVAAGPGSLDPVTGQFTLNATDVSIGGGMGALSVSRSYDSREVTAGAHGPLGSQWQINTAPVSSLEKLPDGSVMSVGPEGLTHFTVKSDGGFEAPAGDSNLTLSSGTEGGKPVYTLADATAGTNTRFTLPGVAEGSTPALYGSEFGGLGSGPGEFYTPVSDAVAANGNVWVTDFYNDRIDEFTSWGEFVASYGTYGGGEGQFERPWGIAISPTSGDMYVSDYDDNRIEEWSQSGAFITSFASYGSGAGQVNAPHGVTVDPSGDVWVADYYNNRVEEFSSAGSFMKTVGFGVSNGENMLQVCTSSCRAGLAGSGNGQFDGPTGIVAVGSDLYVSDALNHRVQELSQAGAYVGKFGSEGSGNGQLSTPDNIAANSVTGDLYVADPGNDRVEVFKPEGAFLATFSAKGKGTGQLETPQGVAVAANGNAYVTDSENNRVEEWEGPPQETWYPSRTEGAAAAAIETYAFQSAALEGQWIAEPTEEVAPKPAGVASCAPLERGCRALKFKYATETTASGENQSEWGEYKGHLATVYFTAWEPVKGEMSAPIAVADYAYDKKGQLRAEWDPRLTEPLKMTYGYSARLVTAIGPPGQQPWLLHYGAIAGDEGPEATGRLLSVARPGAAKPLWKGSVPTNTALPKLSSTSPVIGTTLSVSSNGNWSNEPLSYSYQWQYCNGSQCTAIPGATNQSYTPTAAVAGYALVTQVTATNAGGSATAASAATSAVPMSAPAWSSSFGKDGSGEGEFISPVSDAVDLTGHVWVADFYNDRIDRFSSTGKAEGAYGTYGGGEGQFERPWGIAVSPVSGNLYVTDYDNNRVDEWSASGKFITSFGSEGSGAGQMDAPHGVAVDANGDVWVGDLYNNRVDEFSSTGGFLKAVGWGVSNGESVLQECAASCRAGIAGSGNGEFNGPVGIAAAGNDLYVTDSGNKRVQELSLSGSYISKFGSEGSGNGQFGNPCGITVDPVTGDLYVTDNVNDRVEVFNPAGTYLATFGTKGTGNAQMEGPSGVALSATGTIFVTDTENNRVDIWKPTYSTNNPIPAPPETNGNSVSTIEYHVPLSGTGLQNMSHSEVAKWGQSDDPSEGLAIFPPDKPMGWPASTYERATVTYLDTEGHAVNAATPTGGVSTAEFNEYGEVTRTLSPDDRAAALKEGVKSAEVAKTLSSESKYNGENNEETTEPGTRLLETRGPEHKIKLANDSEVSARNRVKYSYDKGAPAGETYDLVTEATDGALLANGEEKEPRTTITSYSGQENLGWKLRRPTSVTTNPGGSNLTTTTIYEPLTGNVLETRAPEGESNPKPPAVYLGQFGSEGKEKGEFGAIGQDAINAEGDIWVSDRKYDRLTNFAPSGKVVKEFGTEGTAEGDLNAPNGLAVNQSTNLIYVADDKNNRIDVFNEKGVFQKKIGETGSGPGQLSAPTSVAIDASGNVWVADTGNDRVEEFASSGTYLKTMGKEGKANGQLLSPSGVAVIDGTVYVADTANNRIEEFTTNGTYTGQFGSEGKGNSQFNHPVAITADPVSGDMYVADDNNDRIQEFDLHGVFLATFGNEGKGAGQFSGATSAAVNTAGDVYAIDAGNERVEEWEPAPSPPIYMAQFGKAGKEHGEFAEPKAAAITGNGSVDVLDTGNARIEEFSPSGSYITAFATPGTGNGQLKEPYAIAEDNSGNVWVSDTGNDRVQEFNEKHEYGLQFGKEGTAAGQLKEPTGIAVASSGDIFVADSANNRVDRFNKKGEFVRAFGWGVTNGEEKLQVCKATCQAGLAGSGNGQLHTPRGIAVSANGNVWVVDAANDRIDEFNENGEYITKDGSAGKGTGQFEEPKAIAIDPSGNLWVTDAALNRIQEFSPAGTYLTTIGVKGTNNAQFQEPLGMAFTTTSTMYVADAKNNRVQQLAPAPRPGNEGAHDTRTTYYTAKGEAEIAGCREHPEWAGLPCQTEPAAQPGDGLAVPTISVTYNIWDETKATVEGFGSYQRNKTATFDAAGRPLTSEVAGNTDKAVPKVTDTYNTKTGALEAQSTTNGESTETITSETNTLGQRLSYTDAGKNKTEYEYEPEGDTRLIAVNDGKGSQKDSYNTSTGLLTTLTDSAAGALTATYDPEGKPLTETYPYGLVAKNTYNAVGTPTGIEYEKTEHCASKCPETWFADTISPAIHGETITQSSTLSKEGSTYSPVGQLTQTQEESPAGSNCKSRDYTYNEDSDRASLTTDEPGSKGECTTESPNTETPHYDTADRLIDPGTTYEPLGNITKLTTADAGSKGELNTSYYVDGQVATQTQGSETVEYTYDPDGRPQETTTNGKKTTSHYAGPGGALAWTAEGSEWTRDIPGIDGTLTATQTNGGTPTLQLHDLQGDIVGTVRLNETETKLLTTYNSTEFGVPTTTNPPKYSWLGAAGIADTLPSGVTNQGGTSYAPLIARTLQTDGLTIPAAESSNAAYVNTNSSWLAETAGAASAHQIEAANAARRALEGGGPQGSEGGGGQSLEESFNGSNGGAGASAAGANPCKLGLVFGESSPQELFAGGWFSCNKDMRGFKIETCILWEGLNEGKWSNLTCSNEHGKPGEIFTGQSENKSWARVDFCPIGLHYFGWVWGDVLGSGGYQLQPLKAKAITCTGDGSQEFYERVAEFLHDGSGALPEG